MISHPLAPTPHSPGSVASDDLARSASHLAASFVFVESAASTPKMRSRNFSSDHAKNSSASPQTSLLPGESKQVVIVNVERLGRQAPSSGKLTLLVSNLRMLLLDRSDVVQFEIPLSSVLDLKLTSTKLDVKTKDCRFFQFVAQDFSVEVMKILTILAFSPGKCRQPLSVGDSVPIFTLKSEFARMMAKAHHTNLGLPNSMHTNLAINLANQNYTLCPTYPAELVLPAGVSEAVLAGAAKFRDKGRFPVLSWVDGPTGSSVWRSAQPRSSLLNRSAEDEELMRLAGIQFILDCRPMLNAYANIANGAGVESLGNYHSGIELWFGSIPNIHHVRDSWEKVFLLAQQLPNSGWLTALDQTGWFDHLSQILRAASVLCEQISLGKNVLCRCSHGLDRTPQVVSLAMIAMDPFYRSIEGFAILIEKEWVAMGHRFATRYCLGQMPTDETSPIFSQFLEAVYQLQLQHPSQFEFTPTYLVLVLQAVLTSRFGTFQFDCQKDHLPADSAWPHLWRHHEQFTNKAYKPSGKLEIDYHVSQMKLFADIWLTPHRIMI